MKNRSAIVALTAIFIGSGCYAQMLPGDGAVLTAYSVEAEVVDAGAGAVCDLSDAVIRGSEEMSFRYYGDSIVCRKSNMAVEWYEIKGDTVWSLGRNTRDEAMRYRNGAPYLILGSGDACSTVDSLRHLSLMLFDRENITGTEYFAEEGCGFVFSAADTVASTYCVHTVAADSLFTTHCRRWYAPGCVWPVAEDVAVKEAADISQAGTPETNGNRAYALYICPPSEQPAPRYNAKGSGSTSRSPYAYDIQAENHNGSLDFADIAVGGNRFSIASQPDRILISASAPTDSATADNSVDNSRPGACPPCTGYTSRLYDAAGRCWHEGRATTEIPTRNLQPGTYILEITTDGLTQTHKIHIR